VQFGFEAASSSSFIPHLLFFASLNQHQHQRCCTLRTYQSSIIISCYAH
jgi:hypothetical protein